MKIGQREKTIEEEEEEEEEEEGEYDDEAEGDLQRGGGRRWQKHPIMAIFYFILFLFTG